MNADTGIAYELGEDLIGEKEIGEKLDVQANCSPICNHCRYFNFNPDESGAYVNAGRCEHPEHPHPSDPEEICEDFDCKVCETPLSDDNTGD